MTTGTKRIPGLANRAGTQGYAVRTYGNKAPRPFRAVGDLVWSNVGIGTYLGAPDEATDKLVAEAVRASVSSGVNVIDTAANYRAGRGELSVGRALADIFGSGTAKREELIVCTKAGYLPDGPAAFKARYLGKDGIGESDLVGGSHCMHPAYIADRIERSLDALGVASIDVFYVHNPEAQLAHVERREFDRRLAAAFEVLEAAVRDGRIGCYGLATWGAFRCWPGDKAYISLSAAKEIAKRAAGNGVADGFKAVQMPFSVAMPEAYAKPTQWVGDVSVSAFAAARLLGLAVVSSGSIAKAKFPPMNEQVKAWIGADFATDAERALHLARSASGVTSSLVGMKTPAHVERNLAVAKRPPMPRGRFEAMFR